MMLWMFLKVFADACLCFSIAGAFPGMFPPHFSFFWPALLCGIGAAIAAMLTEQGRYELRNWAIALPLASLLLVSSFTDLLVLLPALSYTVLVIYRGDYSLEYYSFRDQYKRAVLFWSLFFMTICGLSYVESLGNVKHVSLSWDVPLMYAIFYVLCGIILLRQLRLGHSGSGTMSGRQLAMVSVGTGGAVFGIVMLERWLQENGGSILQLIWDCILMLFGLPFVLLGQIFGGIVAVMPDDVAEKIENPTGESSQAVVVQPPMPTEEVVEEAVEQAEKSGYPWWLAIILVAVLLVVLLLMMKALRRHSQSNRSDITVSEITAPEREKAEPRRSNRAKVRRYYREFLRSERRKGMKLSTSLTSADILGKIAKDTDLDGASQLRSIYLKARYDETCDVTPEQVKAAKAALKKSRG